MPRQWCFIGLSRDVTLYKHVVKIFCIWLEGKMSNSVSARHQCVNPSSGWNIQGEPDQYHGCWCPGNMCCQGISSNGIDHADLMGPFHPWGKVFVAGSISVLTNDRIYKYNFVYLQDNLAHKALTASSACHSPSSSLSSSGPFLGDILIPPNASSLMFHGAFNWHYIAQTSCKDILHLSEKYVKISIASHCPTIYKWQMIGCTWFDTLKMS